MNTQLLVKLYIRPTNGPISLMQIDMLEIEAAVQNQPHNTNRDDLRIYEIAECVKRQFPNVDPHSRMHDFSNLISRMHQVYLFDGVVLDLPGTIDEGAGASSPSSSPSSPSAATVDEFKRLNEEVNRYRDNWAELEQKYDTEYALARRLEQDNDNLVLIHSRQREEITELRTLQETTQMELDTALANRKKYEVNADQLQQENVQMRTQLEVARRDRQSLVAAQQELAVLRQELAESRKVEQQLSDMVRVREKEITEVRERLRRLTEGVAAISKVDEAKDPWQDA